MAALSEAYHALPSGFARGRCVRHHRYRSQMMFWVMLVNAMAYMPAIALSMAFRTPVYWRNEVRIGNVISACAFFGTIGLLLRCGR